MKILGKEYNGRIGTLIDELGTNEVKGVGFLGRTGRRRRSNQVDDCQEYRKLFYSLKSPEDLSSRTNKTFPTVSYFTFKTNKETR